MSTSKNYQDILAVAEKLHEQKPTWLEFHREIFGISGAMLAKLKTPKERRQFELSPEYEAIQAMVEDLKQTEKPATDATKPLSVRLPEALHETLRQEAHDCYTSMNKLIVAKLKKEVNPSHLDASVMNEKTITPRVPLSIQDALKVEAHDLGDIPVNRLVVAKLQQPIDPSVFKKEPKS